MRRFKNGAIRFMAFIVNESEPGGFMEFVELAGTIVATYVAVYLMCAAA